MVSAVILTFVRIKDFAFFDANAINDPDDDRIDGHVLRLGRKAST